MHKAQRACTPAFLSNGTPEPSQPQPQGVRQGFATVASQVLKPAAGCSRLLQPHCLTSVCQSWTPEK